MDFHLGKQVRGVAEIRDKFERNRAKGVKNMERSETIALFSNALMEQDKQQDYSI